MNPIIDTHMSSDRWASGDTENARGCVRTVGHGKEIKFLV